MAKSVKKSELALVYVRVSSLRQAEEGLSLEAQERTLKAQAEAEEKARLEAEASKPKKKSGGLGFILAGLGIVAAVVTFGATRDK